MNPHASTPTSKSQWKLPATSRPEKDRARRILNALYELYPDARCGLKYTTPHELLAATILSAQATDVSVNKATPALFQAFPTPADYAAASPLKIQKYITPIGLYRNKSKSIHASMTAICEHFDGQVPRTMEELITLHGVARKTANVILGNAFSINLGIAVDTHVLRVSARLNLTQNTTATKVELDLMALFPRPHWTMISHLLITHGRAVCKARSATCDQHPLCTRYCSNANK